MLVDKSILIRASPARVFELLQPARQPQWDRSLVRVAPREAGPLHEGSVFDRVARALGFRFESATEATSVRPGQELAWRQLEGDYEENEGAFVLEREGAWTRLRLVADVELPFVLPRLATEAEVQQGLSRDFDDALFNLKALAEDHR